GDDGDGEQEALGTGGLIGGHIHVLEPGPGPGPAPPLRGGDASPSTGPLCIHWRHTGRGCAGSALCTPTARTPSGRVVAYLPAGQEGPAAVIGGRLTRP